MYISTKINRGLPSMYPAITNINDQPFLQRQQQWMHTTNKKIQYELRLNKK